MKTIPSVKPQETTGFACFKVLGLKILLSRELFIRLILAAALALATFVSTNEFFGGLGGDAMFFLPQVVKYANGLGLVNPQYELTLSYSDAHDGRHIWHGFAYQLFLGGLFVPTTYHSLSFAMAITNALAVFVMVVALGDACQGIQNRFLRFFVLFLAGCVAVGFIMGLQGRPEIFFYLIIPLGYLLSRSSNLWIQAAGGAAVTALAAMTSPLSGLMAGLTLAVLWTARYSIGITLVRQIMTAVLVMAAVIMMLFLIYPYSPSEWFHGVLKHRGPLKDFDLIGHWRSYIIFTGRLFFAPIVLIGFLSALLLIWKERDRSFAAKITPTGINIILFFLSLYLSIFSGWYVLGSLAPAALLCTLFLIGILDKYSSRFQATFLSCFIFVFGLSALDPFLKIIAEFDGCRGLSLSAARSHIASVFGSSISDVAFSKSLFVLSDQTNNIDILPHEGFAMGDKILSQRRWAVIQQANSGFVVPPSYRNYRLVVNAFQSCKPGPGRLEQWFGPKGMGFAIYERYSDRMHALPKS